MLSMFRTPDCRLANSVWSSTSLRRFSSCPVYRLRKRDYDLLRLDPEKHKAHIERNTKYAKEKYASDAAYRMKLQSSDRIRYATDEAYARMKTIFRWCVIHKWFRELPWKSHHPIIYPERVEHYCTGCERTRFRGHKFWWTNSESYMCNACYTKAGWNEAMPKGYEDCRTITEVAARKKQFDAWPSANKSS